MDRRDYLRNPLLLQGVSCFLDDLIVHGTACSRFREPVMPYPLFCRVCLTGRPVRIADLVKRMPPGGGMNGADEAAT